MDIDDSFPSHFCYACRTAMHDNTFHQSLVKSLTFLDRLTAFDITFLSHMDIACEEDMLRAACDHPG